MVPLYRGEDGDTEELSATLVQPYNSSLKHYQRIMKFNIRTCAWDTLYIAFGIYRRIECKCYAMYRESEKQMSLSCRLVPDLLLTPRNYMKMFFFYKKKTMFIIIDKPHGAGNSHCSY